MEQTEEINIGKNYRDVGNSLSSLGCDVLPPGILLRSSAWDTQPNITWKDLGRPKVILNLREYHAIESYDRLAQDLNGEYESSLTILKISAKNNVEKYDLSQSEPRDWLIMVLKKILEDKEEIPLHPIDSTDHAESSTKTDLFETDVPSPFPNDEASLNNNSSSYNNMTPFRYALAVILRRRLSEWHAPLLIHCRFGRDRTGIVVAFLLKLLVPSISDSIVLKEFLLSDVSYLNSNEKMDDLGQTFLTLTLNNLSSLYDEIEVRQKRLFADPKFKSFRDDLSELMNMYQMKKLKGPIILTNSFKIDKLYIKSEARYYFKRMAMLRKNITIGPDERYYFLWLSFVCHYSALKWLQWHQDFDTEMVQDEEFEVLMKENLNRINLQAIAIQLGRNLIDVEADKTFPLPMSYNSLREINDRYMDLCSNLVKSDEIINSFGRCPASLQKKFYLLRNKILRSSL